MPDTDCTLFTAWLRSPDAMARPRPLSPDDPSPQHIASTPRLPSPASVTIGIAGAKSAPEAIGTMAVSSWNIRGQSEDQAVRGDDELAVWLSWTFAARTPCMATGVRRSGSVRIAGRHAESGRTARVPCWIATRIEWAWHCARVRNSRNCSFHWLSAKAMERLSRFSPTPNGPV